MVLRNLLRMIYRICLFLSSACIGTILIISILQVFSRYFYGKSFIWVEELSRYLLIWGTLLGLVAVSSQNDMIRIEYVLGKIKSLFIAKLIRIIISFLTLTLFIFIAQKTLVLMKLNNETISASMGFPLSYIYLAIFMTSIMIICIYIIQFMLTFLQKKKL